MNLRTLAIVLFSFAASASPADEAVNKLMAGHEQARKGDGIDIGCDAEIARVKQWITDASQPVGGTAGPQPADFKVVYYNGEGGFLGSWENGELKANPQGFSWTNKGTPADLVHTTVLTGAFEAEFSYKGNVYTVVANEADYSKYVQFYFAPPADGGKHTIKLKRTAAGALSGELDGKPVTLNLTPGARQDMHLRVGFRILKDAAVEIREATIKDLSAKK